jgi:hypothetical protein
MLCDWAMAMAVTITTRPRSVVVMFVSSSISTLAKRDRDRGTALRRRSGRYGTLLCFWTGWRDLFQV